MLAKFYWMWQCNRWLLLRFDALGSFATLISTSWHTSSPCHSTQALSADHDVCPYATYLAFAIAFSVSAGSSAIAILATQSFVTALYWICRNLSQVELAFNAVERVDEWTYLFQTFRAFDTLV
jgi:ABC-type multidrug transport system fused ATPase/permease subunit